MPTVRFGFICKHSKWDGNSFYTKNVSNMNLRHFIYFEVKFTAIDFLRHTNSFLVHIFF